MTTIPQINHTAIAGFDRPEISLPSQQERLNPSSQNQRPKQITEAQYTSHSSQYIRQSPRTHALQDQNLSHQGSLAKESYQEIEQSNEAELMPRLNVVA